MTSSWRVFGSVHVIWRRRLSVVRADGEVFLPEGENVKFNTIHSVYIVVYNSCMCHKTHRLMTWRSSSGFSGGEQNLSMFTSVIVSLQHYTATSMFNCRSDGLFVELCVWFAQHVTGPLSNNSAFDSSLQHSYRSFEGHLGELAEVRQASMIFWISSSFCFATLP